MTRRSFPEANLGALKFLVLDEVHTYTGKQGADVAYLIRRLKQHTKTTGRIRCIGTSATVQSTAGEDASVAISAFASRLFGEVFEASSVVTETYKEPSHQGEGLLPEKLLVTQEMISLFDGSKEKTRSLVEALLGKSVSEDKASLKGLGELLGSQRTVQFLEKSLFRKSLNKEELVEAYKSEVRPIFSSDECWRELRAAFLAGMNAEIEFVARTRVA